MSRDVDVTLRRFLERAARERATRASYRYGNFYELVLEQGRPWTAIALPPLARRGQAQFCYQNTLRLVREAGALLSVGLDYCEGFALPVRGDYEMVPIHHAWAVDELGQVWDRTWPEPERSAYFGIRFRIEDVERFDALGEEYVGILESDYLRGFPLLRTGRLYPEDDPCPVG